MVSKNEEFVLKNEQFFLTLLNGSFVLMQGEALVCCAPLVVNKQYTFKSRSFTFEVPKFARIRISGEYSFERGESNFSLQEVVSRLDQARAFASAHLQGGDSLSEADRNFSTNSFGPRVLIVGDVNTGKSYTALSLINSATRCKEFAVAYVDADVGQQGVSCPGCVSTVLVDTPQSILFPFTDLLPASFFFGEVQVTARSKERYIEYCQSCFHIFRQHAQSMHSLGAGGLVINTMGWINKLGLTILCELAVVFEVTHIVLTSEDAELEAALRQAVCGQPVEFLRVHLGNGSSKTKSGKGKAVTNRGLQIKRYFEGTVERPLIPVRVCCPIKEVEFFDASTYKPLPLNRLRKLALCSASKLDAPNDLRRSSSAGFLVILEVGEEYVSFLSPQSGYVPKKILVSPTIEMPPHLLPPIPIA